VQPLFAKEEIIMTEIITLILLLIIVLLVVVWLMKSFKTVPEGYVAITNWMDRYARILEPGPHLLMPFEEEKAQIKVRQSEGKLAVPNVFTHGGLPVVVNLRYTYRLDPRRMHRDELYYLEDERREQQVNIFKQIFQEVIAELAPSAEQSAQKSAPQNPQGGGGADKGTTPSRVDIAGLFSPFVGRQGIELKRRVEERARKMLAEHGVMLATNAPFVIYGLQLPDVIVEAYMDLIASDFNSTAMSDFIARVRNATNMSEAGLVQLLNVIQNPSADLRAIFASGFVQPEMHIQDGKPGVRQRVPDAPTQREPDKSHKMSSDETGQPKSTPSPLDLSAMHDLPLTEEVMRTLKSP
jgi:hypothetical protein